MSNYEITTRGNWEYATVNGTLCRRRRGTEEWTLVEQAPSESEHLLSLVLQNQGPGEPTHWSLFVAPEGEIGQVYQVKGDAELMHYTHIENINILNSTSFRAAYTLANLTQGQARRVAYYANSEVPPSAPNRASVNENCQGWTVRVLQRLVEEDIVTTEWLEYVRGLVEPI